ncbi:hypothetical protein M378DRAFT_17871 [Amanita muscaria Koide BX008]|uniref:SWIM-type domain-containing protein n=1 Tax=Amanita muscaria (strain Koide BX008) TaxID=946122 RepID=A0A0C2WHF6_AMAMK|nr:hypothetical protein M378DRAFT_17871 [Amanita muscaria Koide BX008]
MAAATTILGNSDPDAEVFMGLPVLDSDMFLGAIAQSAAHIETLEALVQVPLQVVEGKDDLKESANGLVEKINARMKYRFTMHSRYDHKRMSGTHFMYHCAQSKTRQHDSQTSGNQTKQRDKESMTAFQCNGWIYITLYQGNPVAFVKIRHEEEHVPYWCIDVPPEVKAYIKDNTGLNAPEVEPITLPDVPGFTAITFSLPNVLRKWGGQLREFSLDSAWNTNKSGYEVYALLGEIYGSGSLLGYLLLKSSGEGVAGGKEKYITSLLSYFKTQWNHYDILEACKEFRYINQDFVPIGQSSPKSTASESIPALSQKATPRITVLLNGVLQNGAPKPPLSQRCLVLHVNGVVRSFCDLPENINYEGHVPTDNEEEAEDELTDNNFSGIDALVDRFVEKDNSQDQEDGPDWMFDAEEVLAKDPKYIFCPTVHRKQILHLFTKHFCQHPLFPKRSQTEDGVWDSHQIRNQAVWDMYQFCFQRGLREVWGYMWANWYSPKMWELWARSTSRFISRLLDRLVWTLIHKVTPAYFAQAEVLDDTHRLGRSKPLTTYQKYFKSAWKILAKAQISGKVYETDVMRWTCTCGRQKYDRHHLCKHLVQMVPEPAANFWREVVCR